MKKFSMIFLALLIVLCSCGEAKNISFSEMSETVKSASGRELTDKDIKEDDCYIIGISEKTYKNGVENAKIFSPVFSSDGFELILIKTKTAIDAERLCAEMKSNYEPVPQAQSQRRRQEKFRNTIYEIRRRQSPRRTRQYARLRTPPFRAEETPSPPDRRAKRQEKYRRPFRAQARKALSVRHSRAILKPLQIPAKQNSTPQWLLSP